MTKIDADQFLRNDHKMIRALFGQTKASELRAPEMSEGVVQELLMILEIHSTLEEEIFYPALQQFTDAASLIAQSFDDHHQVDTLIQKIRTNLKSVESGMALIELRDAVDLHFLTEEKELFPLAQTLLGTQMMDLGVQMQQRREELLTDSKYEGARAELTQDPNGGEQMRKPKAA